MQLATFLALGIGAIILLWIVLSLPRRRRVVPRHEAHVVIKRRKVVVYSGTAEIQGIRGTTYYYFPSWVPVLGMDVTQVPLSVLELRVPEMVTFAARTARFTLTASVFVRVTDPLKSAQRWPGRSVEDFVSGVKELMENAIRNTTTAFAAEDIIEKKDEIASKLQHALSADMDEYGCIITNVGIVDITDAPDNTVISDIAQKREAEINSESRQIVAIKEREARVVEAENTQASEMRESEAAEAIGVRNREKEQRVFVSQQKVATEEMEVERIRQVRAAEIERDATIERAQGQRQAVILKREAEAEGTKSVGMAEAEVTRSRGMAEAEAISKRAAALNRLQEADRSFRIIEKDEKVGLELAKALQHADLKLVSTGKVDSFLDLFSANGGASLGAFMSSLRQVEPELADRLLGVSSIVWENLRRARTRRRRRADGDHNVHIGPGVLHHRSLAQGISFNDADPYPCAHQASSQCPRTCEA